MDEARCTGGRDLGQRVPRVSVSMACPFRVIAPWLGVRVGGERVRDRSLVVGGALEITERTLFSFIYENRFEKRKTRRRRGVLK